MKVLIEAAFWLTVDAASVEDGLVIGDKIRLKNPQTSETLTPVWLKGWKQHVKQDGEVSDGTTARG